MTWAWVMVYEMVFLFISILAALAGPAPAPSRRELKFDGVKWTVQMRELSFMRLLSPVASALIPQARLRREVLHL